jgi:hypothetical protein
MGGLRKIRELLSEKVTPRVVGVPRKTSSYDVIVIVNKPALPGPMLGERARKTWRRLSAPTRASKDLQARGIELALARERVPSLPPKSGKAVKLVRRFSRC